MSPVELFLNTFKPMLSMPWLWLAVVFLAVVAVLTAKKRSRRRDFPYVRRERLITAAERRFLATLDEACGSHYRVFAQVRVGDVLQVERGHDASLRTSALNRINSKHVDFVVTDRETLRIVCCIELDDRSHRQAHRQDRDAFLNAAFAAAGLPLLRVPCRERYDVREIRGMLKDAISGR